MKKAQGVMKKAQGVMKRALGITWKRAGGPPCEKDLDLFTLTIKENSWLTLANWKWLKLIK
jgi:hypothetical protein